MFDFHNPCCARTAWSGLDNNSYYHWDPQTLGCNLLALIFTSILRKPHLLFLPAVPVGNTMSLFRSRWSFLLSTSSPILSVHLKLELLLPVLCKLAMCPSDSRQIQSGKFQCLGVGELCQLPTPKFSSNIRLMSLSKFFKNFGFNSNLWCFLFSLISSYVSKKHW